MWRLRVLRCFRAGGRCVQGCGVCAERSLRGTALKGVPRLVLVLFVRCFIDGEAG